MNFKNNSPVRAIVLHSSATPEGKPFNAADITRWHRQRGFTTIGYHYVILLDGTVEKGRPDNVPGAHAVANGWNRGTLGVVYIGGTAADGKTPKDTRNPAQLAAMEQLVRRLTAEHPGAQVMGHRDTGAKTACPSFDARQWWADLNP